MIIIDPVTFGDVVSSRPSPKNVYDKAGTLVTVPAGQVAISYDPTDLTKAPFVVVEAATTNRVKSSQDLQHAGAWAAGANNLVPKISSTTKSYRGIPFQEVAKGTTGTSEAWGAALGSVSAGRTVLATFALMAGTSSVAQIGLYALDFSDWGGAGSGSARIIEGPGQLSQAPYGGGIFNVTGLSSALPTLIEISRSYAQTTAAALYFYPGNSTSTTVGDSILVTRVQSEDYVSTSYWPTPPAFGSRASTGTYFDAAGVLQTAAANVARLTYDPLNLALPPRLMVEGAATKCLPANDDLMSWAIFNDSGGGCTRSIVTDPQYGNVLRLTKTSGGAGVRVGITNGLTGLSGTAYASGAFIRRGTASASGYAMYVDAAKSGGGLVTKSVRFDATTPSEWNRYSIGSNTGESLAGGGNAYILIDSNIGDYIDIKLPEVELGTTLTSPMVSAASGTTLRAADIVTYAQSRAADSIGSGIGLVYSNVAITETVYNIGTTYAQGAQVYDPTTYLMYQSLISANTGKVLSDTTAWTPMGKSVNRWQMFDSYNYTQTANADEIVVCVNPKMIAQGVYLGNVDATEVRISVVDLAEGVVYRETQSLVVPDSKSSFYNWCFKRIRRKSYAVSVALPPYANSLVTIAIRKPGGTVKCGVCTIGPLIDVGLSQYGLSREIRDFSTVNFNFDGTSNQVVRNFAKRMDVDVSIDNEAIDSVIEALEGYRQKPVVWIGAKEFGAACVFGRYSSFKNVIPNKRRSQMNLQIEGTV